jgi:hypothetical protein
MTYITAIEFLECELSKSHLTNEEIQIIFEKAKFMEKEQIIFAFEMGTIESDIMTSEEYYYKTYENIDHGLNS